MAWFNGLPSPVRWALTLFAVVAILLVTSKMLGGAAHQIRYAIGETVAGFVDGAGDILGGTPAEAQVKYHERLKIEQCFEGELRNGRGCKDDPNANPYTSSREQSDGSEYEQGFCPKFGAYQTYMLTDGSRRCKLETHGPLETAPVPDGWEMKEYDAGNGAVGSAKAGDIVTTASATLSKTAP